MFSLALRFLLAVALVLNGSASAVAGVGMAMAASPGAVKSAHHDMAMPSGMDCADHHGSPEGTDPGDPSPADCCDSSACSCACAHVQSTAVALTHVLPRLDPSMKALLPLTAGHRSPALPHLIRPPISKA